MTRIIAPLAAHLRDRAFAPGVPRDRGALRIGAEVELVPVLADSGRPCPVEGEGGPALLPFLRGWSTANGWLEWKTAKGVPGFCTPDGGRITFEPGGQVEYSAPPAASASALLASLRALVVPLRAAALDGGIELLSLGIDPLNGDGCTPLQLHSERYD
ncbi:MAG: glutamate-cysteine ligase family protein, partial [Gemmatimonadaceae bacterium]